MDELTKPKHHTQGSVECLDDIDAMMGDRGRLDTYRAMIVKYIWRCFDKGDAVTDLKKARWYIDRLIGVLEK